MDESQWKPRDRLINCGLEYQPIAVQYRDARRFYKTRHYDSGPGLNWVEICVHHEGILNFTTNPKELILNAIYETVENEPFYPVNYKTGQLVDSFFVRACKPALDLLFKRSLTLRLISGASIPMAAWFNVAEHQRSHISPTLIISQVTDRLLNRLENHRGVENVVNLSKFNNHPAFKYFEVRLKNSFTFHLVCSTIHNNDDRRRAIKGFNLSQNDLTDISPMRIFGDFDYELLDITGNSIQSSKRLCSDLERVRAKHLYLANNPLTKANKFPDCLSPLINNFQFVDGVPFDKLHKLYTPLNYEIDMECDGVRIDWTNKSMLSKFKDSKHWHAFLIPDADHKFNKEDLFNFFFVMVSPELSEFYPCYYKFESAQHRFLVRECFDQIEHLVNDCNLQIKIPQITPDEQELTYRNSIPYFLRMNVTAMKQGHLQPKKCIEQALQHRFNATNRVLNLEDFQSSEQLENVIVSLSSPRILSSVLRMASRKFLGNCIELRLGDNKILGLNLRTLSLLNGLLALDLGKNWIYDLSMLTALNEIPLRSLRLHGNPLCQKYVLPSEYIRDVKKVCPGLLRLDDVDLSTKPGLTPQKDFLCDTSGYELAGELFLYPYLQDFEQTDTRLTLNRFYTDESIFTLTCSFDIRRAHPTKPTNELCKRINKYNYFSRNLLKNSMDTCRVHVGEHDVMQALMQLPEVTHDYISLQTDVMHHDEQGAMIYVTGVLRDEPDLLLAFSRQFVLRVRDTGRGVGEGAQRMIIANERLNIMNPTPKQLRDAFKVVKPPEVEPEPDDSLDVKEHKLHIFQEITGLRPKWCTRILQEEANWSIRSALHQFLQLDEKNELPDEAFI
ncbi:PREDICTED: nuclear RNA export factor 2 [Drosophila arizonae]|uniref:Nuclear RNA export factor 2 n=1 Tax=Drosophila arizonae TaxID=7263 RepID=A0ABM1P1W2_DROAR|nr:PREDICTED: nuclear RNA export factor 2 [Drosophila arizonae]